ncbi:Fic family protein [Turicibacter sp. 1E2]|uniref:Fic family protein n=1 Tax=unclassified Turicibacter TaxID=2638206 RepID=UPI001379D9EE|nr:MULTISPECIES: Fic family protein [unclassified Turicibacter]MCU7209644.1 Fic family protein [Turicibacter sp. 1E2]NCE79348.1 Fic family protein [Turicibacter sp. TS3]
MVTLLGEKKQLLDSKRPLSREVLMNLKKYFDVEFTYNSNAIEGNTLTITETKVILEDGLTIGGGKSLREHLEVLNHKEAIDYVQDVVSKEFDLSERVIRDLHHIILKSIDNSNAGVYRKANVLISGSMHRPPEYFLVEDKMKELLDWYHENKETMHPVKLAALFHFKYVYIHPFLDGNGRSARLLMNLILLRNGYPLTIIRNSDRVDYMSALEKASTTGNTDDFVEFIAKAVDRSFDTYLYLIG